MMAPKFNHFQQCLTVIMDIDLIRSMDKILGGPYVS